MICTNRTLTAVLLTANAIGCVWASPTPASDSVEARYCYVRKAAQLDPGTVHLYIYNGRREPWTIDKAWLNHRSLLSDPGSIYWWQMSPNPIPSGMVGDLMIKLRKASPSAPLVSVASTKAFWGRSFRVVQTPRVKFTYIAFSDDRTVAYLYLKNISAKPINVTALEILPAENRASHVRYIASSPTRPGEVCCAIAQLRKAPLPGQFMWFAAKAAGDSITGCALVRAYTYFPIQAFGNDHRQELFFDKDGFEIGYPSTAEGWKDARSQPWYKAYSLCGDPVCADAHVRTGLGTSALEVLRQAGACRTQDPVHPTLIYMCEFMKPQSYFVYGETTDVLAIDPYPLQLEGASVLRNSYYVSQAKLATEPRPLYTIPEAFAYGVFVPGRYPTPEEERMTVYLQLAFGSKGIWYFVMNGADGYDAYPALREEIGSINAELRFLRPYLQISDPADLARCQLTAVEPRALLCADKGIVVIVMNKFDSWPRSKENPNRPGERPFYYQPVQNVKISVSVPSGVSIGRVRSISGTRVENVRFVSSRGRIDVTLSRLNLTALLLLTP